MSHNVIRKAVFPVAGLGTRFLPATKAAPKEMLPVVDKPLIQYAVEEAYAAGVRHMIFVTGRSKRAIEDHFDTAYELETELEAAHKDELLALAEVAEQRDWIICSDDIHCELLLEPGVRYTPLASLSPEIARRTISLFAPSKTYNIPGLGASFAVIPDAGLRRRFEHVMAGIVPHINVLGYTAMEAAFRHGVPWRNALLDYLRGNRDRLVAAVNAMPGLKVHAPEATYLAWINARGLQLPEGMSAAQFFEAAGVGLSPGQDFQMGASDYVRMNFGCTRQTLDEALARMATACARQI